MEKALLADLETLRDELVERVHATAGDAHVRQIQDAARISWVSLDHGIALRDAAYEVLGRDTYVRLIHALTLKSLDFPAFKTLGAGLMRMFDASPVGLAKASARAWTTFTRDVGTFEFASRGPGRVVAHYVDVPAKGLASPGLLATHEGSFRAALDLAGHPKGTVERTDAGEQVDYAISW